MAGVLAVAATMLVVALTAGAAQANSPSTGVAPHAYGNLDCNGLSPIQRPVRVTMPCADPRSLYDGYPTRFSDNGHYVGHDEPSIRFLSSIAGSADNITWNETLPTDPSALPTVATPGSDVTHWFELSAAPWFGMSLCDTRSYPQAACKPESDKNAPKNPPTYNVNGGGSAFLELQFYPPGMAPLVDSESCDNSHWCAAMAIFSLECTLGFHSCNNNCIEPFNFALIQTDGTPTGPPGPQTADLATFTPNAHTLLMNPGDSLTVHIFDAALPGGGHALEGMISDLTTDQSGFMQASAANGFLDTNKGNCNGFPFNFEPEYSRALLGNITSWAALQGGILSQFEIGHFTPCISLSGSGSFTIGSFTDPFATTCSGPYESTASADSGNPEGTDAPCYPAGDTHGSMATDPNLVTGCPGIIGPPSGSSDLDYDGTSYWPDWPNAVTPGTFPSPFLQHQPTTAGQGYAQVQFETDSAATQSTCGPTTLSGCAVPPPGGPGNFYPYWTQASVAGQCVWEFGQMTNGNTFSADAQYDGPSPYFFGTLSGPPIDNPACT
jgi:hypothetical protein